MSEIKNIDMPFTRHQFVYDVYNVEQFSFLCVTTFYDFAINNQSSSFLHTTFKVLSAVLLKNNK